jgi:hypothetical protein
MEMMILADSTSNTDFKPGKSTRGKPSKYMLQSNKPQKGLENQIYAAMLAD